MLPLLGAGQAHHLDLRLCRSFPQFYTMLLDVQRFGEAVGILQVIFDIFDALEVLGADATGPVLDVVVGDEMALESLVCVKKLVADGTAHIPVQFRGCVQ